MLSNGFDFGFAEVSIGDGVHFANVVRFHKVGVNQRDVLDAEAGQGGGDE